MVWGYKALLNMTDGNGKDGVSCHSNDREIPETFKKTKKSGVDEFAHAIARIAVAQVCEGLGFQSFHQSALDTFADVGVRYIEEIGKRAVSYGSLGNRIDCNVFDVIQGLEDLCSIQGFSGAADARPSALGSGVVKDIMRYVRNDEDIPFAYLIPDFPVVKEQRVNISFAQADLITPDEHIPQWLPKLPNTWELLDKGSENGAQRKIEPVGINDKNFEKHLHQRTICNGSEVDVAIEPSDASKGQPAVQTNPFLAPPLQLAEKDVSLPTLPAKLLGESSRCHQSQDPSENNVSHFEPVMLAQEAAGGSPHELVDNRNSLLCARPGVQFKFRNRKKCMDTRSEESEKISVWFCHNRDEKDFKKRNDQNCVDRMEFSQDAAQL